MLRIRTMTASNTPSWIRNQEPEEHEEVVITAAEIAECCCPEPCDRDHDFD
jgi:hypothetical protein